MDGTELIIRQVSNFIAIIKGKSWVLLFFAYYIKVQAIGNYEEKLQLYAAIGLF